MSTTLKRFKKVHACKDHECSRCNCAIPKDTFYYIRTTAIIIKQKLCSKCRAKEWG